jgi:hypothetical protein
LAVLTDPNGTVWSINRRLLWPFRAHGDLPAAMFLETEAPNDGARRFYVRHGFSADDSLCTSRPLYSTDTVRGDKGVSGP